MTRPATSKGGKPRKRRGVLELFALFFACLVLLVLSRLDYEPLREARERFADFAAPMLEAASAPAAHVREAGMRAASFLALYDELDRLKAENARLREWEWRAQRLKSQLDQLRGLVNAVEEPGLRYASARVIADARGPFARSVLINAGRGQGVEPGYAVISADGLVGRVVSAGESASRVILITDLNSRIPVLVGPTAARAILFGENGPDARLEFPRDGERFLLGDDVYTSGDDGVLPRGLRVGVLTQGEGAEFRVRPHARLQELDYVSVLFFDAPSILTARDPREAPAMAIEPLPAEGEAGGTRAAVGESTVTR